MKTGLNKWLEDVNQALDYYLDGSPFKMKNNVAHGHVETDVSIMGELVATFGRRSPLSKVLEDAEDTQFEALMTIRGCLPMICEELKNKWDQIEKDPNFVRNKDFELAKKNCWKVIDLGNDICKTIELCVTADTEDDLDKIMQEILSQ